jgi:ABC-type nitrate/sulfonate/bicarbonate transport system substrate-binding protein
MRKNRALRARRLVQPALAALLALTVGTAVAQNCAKMDVVKVQEYTGYIVNLTTWVAMDQGILKKYCIEPQIVAIPSAPAAFAASVQGGVDFIMSSTDTTFIPASQGLDVKIVGSINNTIFYAMIVGKHLKLTPEQLQYPAVIKALEGKTIGVNAFGASMDGFARYTVRAAGADLSKYKWVAYGAFPNGVAGLTNGTIDAIEASGDAMDIAAATTGGTIVADFRDKETIKKLPQVAAITGANMMWVSPTAFVKKNPEVVRRFVDAQNETIAWIRDPKNFDAVVKVVAQKAPSPEGVPERDALTVERVRHYIVQLSPNSSRKAMDEWNQFVVSEKRMPKPVDFDALIWEGAKGMMIP